MALMRWDPFSPLRRRDDVFEDLFREFFRPPAAAGETEVAPPAEISEADGQVTVKMPLPGVEREHVQVSVEDDVVTVRGEMRQDTDDRKRSFYRQEIRYGRFRRSLALPVEVDATKATAALKNGMLTITIPKSTQPKAHEVKVAVG
ncbi:MAG TPA: Hsp20/alpha crystallin family protein [Candidatus Binatia bacterium]|nr:Hsp20/alpha crystallin family protein [Candidatus Binatia bacterium]